MKKVNKIIWPTYIYLIILLFFYALRDINTPLIIDTFIIFVGPIFLLLSLIRNFRFYHKKRANLKSLFLYSLIPGFLLGFQVSYGLYAVGHGNDFIKAILPFLTIGIFFGLVSGISGLIINSFVGFLKKLK